MYLKYQVFIVTFDKLYVSLLNRNIKNIIITDTHLLNKTWIELN